VEVQSTLVLSGNDGWGWKKPPPTPFRTDEHKMIPLHYLNWDYPQAGWSVLSSPKPAIESPPVVSLIDLDPQPAPPRSSAVGAKAPFVVRRNESQEYSSIIIPRRFLPVMYETPPGGFDALLEQLQTSSSDTPQRKAMSAGVLLTTVITGGGLAVAFVRRRKVGAAVAALVTMLLLAIAVESVMANAAALRAVTPRPHIDLHTSFLEIPDLETGGHRPLSWRPGDDQGPQVVVQVAELGDEIILTLGNDSP
jgi:hypothetical protein